jgi:hypothetical protein
MLRMPRPDHAEPRRQTFSAALGVCSARLPAVGRHEKRDGNRRRCAPRPDGVVRMGSCQTLGGRFSGQNSLAFIDFVDTGGRPMSTTIRQAWLALPMALVMIAGCGGKPADKAAESADQAMESASEAADAAGEAATAAGEAAGAAADAAGAAVEGAAADAAAGAADAAAGAADAAADAAAGAADAAAGAAADAGAAAEAAGEAAADAATTTTP